MFGLKEVLANDTLYSGFGPGLDGIFYQSNLGNPLRIETGTRRMDC